MKEELQHQKQWKDKSLLYHELFVYNWQQCEVAIFDGCMVIISLLQSYMAAVREERVGFVYLKAVVLL